MRAIRSGATPAATQGQQKGETTALAPLYCRRNCRQYHASFPAISRVFIDGSLHRARRIRGRHLRRYGGNRVLLSPSAIGRADRGMERAPRPDRGDGIRRCDHSGFELCEAQALPGREEYLHSEKYEIRARDWNAPGNIIAEL